MKNIIKKAMALAMAGSLVLGTGVTAFAADTAVSSNLNQSSDNLSDTDTIYLLKDYINGSSTQSNTKSPNETFTFTIVRYGLWNVGEDGSGNATYTKSNMPTFGENNKGVFEIKADADTAGKTTEEKPSVLVTVPTYAAVGDYWYQVTETDNNVAGVLYGTNDNKDEHTTQSNGNHKGIYYIHVQVTNGDTKGSYIRTVTLHKTAPDADVNNAGYEEWYNSNNKNSDGLVKKVNDIQNKYYAGSLKITKKVTGNAGDKNKLFRITVEFKNDSDANMNSDITYKDFYSKGGTLTSSDTILNWKDTVTNQDNTIHHTSETTTVSFYVKDGTTVTFDNIPYGVSYTITETQPTDDKYTHLFQYDTADVAGNFNGVTTSADTVTAENTTEDIASNWNAAKATGSISDDLDTVTITNNKESVIDIGVITSNAPYAAILVLAGAAVVVMIRRRRNQIEE